MVRKFKMLLNEEGGAVSIVEATYVFPIMFIILFFLIYMGNAFYFKAEIEALATKKALEGAAYCADPMLETMKKNSYSVPKLSELDVKPYRYLFGGMDGIETNIENDVKSMFKSDSFTLMKNMKPKLKSNKSDIATYKNYIIYSTFSVDINYQIPFPIKFLGSSTPVVLDVSTHSEIAVNDATEFIRNTDMAIDYFSGNEMFQKVESVFNKINEFLSSFAEK